MVRPMSRFSRIHDVRAGELHTQLEENGQSDANGQHDQSGNTMGGNDAVIYLHGKDRSTQGDDAHHDRCENDLKENGPEFGKGFLEDAFESILPAFGSKNGKIDLANTFSEIAITDQCMALLTNEDPATVGTLIDDDAPTTLLHNAQHGQLTAIWCFEKLCLG